MAEAGVKVSKALAQESHEAGVDTAYIYVEEGEKIVKIISNGMVDIDRYIPGLDKEACGIYERVRYKIVMDILEKASSGEEAREMAKARVNELIPKHIIKEIGRAHV